MPRKALLLIIPVLTAASILPRSDAVVAQRATLSATFIVNNANDSGSGSLRQVVTDANSSPGADTITFAAGVFATLTTITLTSGEIAISDSLTISGPGSSFLNISGNSNSRIFSITAGNHQVAISGVSLINAEHTAPGGGGAILNSSTGTLTLSNSVIRQNSSHGSGNLAGQGGALFNASSGTVNVVNCNLSDNSAIGGTGGDLAVGHGGAIFNASSGTITLTNSVLSGNLANGGTLNPPFGFGLGEGGGIYNASTGTVSLLNATLSDNSAHSSVLPGTGGGIFNAGTGTVTVMNSTISSNRAVGSQGLGAGVANSDGTVTIANSTIADNSGIAGGIGQGGGVYHKGTGTVHLVNSTVTRNSVVGQIQSEGGGLFNSGIGVVNVRNSIIAGNSATIQSPDVRGPFTSQGHNLIGNGTGGSGFTGSGDQVGNSAIPIDPGLAALANNGGPTQTSALLTGSPAIDAGDNCVTQSPGCLTTPLSTDQRGSGFARNGGGTVDIGAFEVQLSLEADVVPRPLGNGSVSLTDWVQAGRFAVGLDATASSSEFQRADCAPKETGGNGALSLADWVQAGRYAALLDPATPAAGPTSPSFGFTAGGFSSAKNSLVTPKRSMVVIISRVSRTLEASVGLWLTATGTENAVSLSISFDQEKWELVSTKAGAGASGAVLLENGSHISNGRLGIALALSPGGVLEPGWRELAEIKLRPRGRRGERIPEIEVNSNGPVAQEVVDVFGNIVDVDWRTVRRP